MRPLDAEGPGIRLARRPRLRDPRIQAARPDHLPVRHGIWRGRHADCSGRPVGSPVASVTLPATGIGNLPQSVELSARSGVAQDWLVFASVKWTDWSVLQNSDRHHAAFHRHRSVSMAGRLDRYRRRRSFLQRRYSPDRSASPGTVASAPAGTCGATSGRSPSAAGCGPRSAASSAAASASAICSRGEETQYANAIIPGNIHSGFNAATDSGFAATFNAGYIVQW